MKAIEIGTARSTGPGRVEGLLKVAEAPDGTDIAIPVIIVRGEKDGPVLWVQACVHGDEYCGTRNVQTFLKSLNPAEMSGTVIGLPILNITAFRAHHRMSPHEGFNLGDMNRCFPGNPNGGFTEQMAHVVYTHLKAHATHLIDFHTAFTFDTRWALYADIAGEVGEAGYKMARAFGYANTLPTPVGTLAGSSMMTAGQDGIPAYIIEAGGLGDQFDLEIVEDVAERLRNIARALEILPGEVTDYGPLTVFSNFHWATSPRGGIFRPLVKTGEPVTEGQHIGTYYSLHGEAQEEARSPASGVVLAYHPGPIIPQGDVLIHIGLDPRSL